MGTDIFGYSYPVWYKIMKKTLAVILATIIFLSLTVSCSKKNERKEQLYYYMAEFIEADEKINSVLKNKETKIGRLVGFGHFNNAGIWNDRVLEGTLAVSPTVLLTFDYKSGNMSRTEFKVRMPESGIEGSARSDDLAFLGTLDDGTYVFIQKYLNLHFDGESINTDLNANYPYNHWYLTNYNSDGIMTYSKLLYDIDETIGGADTTLTSDSVFLSSDGTVYIFSRDYFTGGDSYVVAMTPTGEVKSSFRLKDVCPDYASGNITFNSVREDMNGNICVVFERFNPDDGYNHFEFCRYDDLANGNEYKPVKFRQDFGYGLLVAFSDKEAYFSTVYGLDRETVGENGYDQILNWLDVDISGCSDIYFESLNRFVLTFTDEYTFESYFIIVTRTEEPYESQRDVITVAYDESKTNDTRAKATRNLLNIVSRFNRTSDDYRIKLIPYSSDDVSTANDKLYRDIISGEMPDMVLFGGSITADPFLKTGAFMDLYKFMDKDETYTQDAFLPCVLEPFEVKGKLPYIVTNFSFETLAGLTDVIGDKTSWTVDEFAELVDSLESGQYLMKVDSASDPQYELFRTILPYIVSDYVDYNKEKCDFGKEFKKLLETCKRAPVKAVDGYLATENYLDGDVVLGKISLGETQGYMEDRFAMFGDRDITLIGAPTEKGSGTALMYDLAFSITKDCAFPEGAWEFIKYYISAGPGQWENFIEMPQTVYFADGFIPTKETEEEMFTVLDTMVFYFNTTPTRLDNGDEGISLSRWIGTKISTNELTLHIQDRANGMNNYYHKQLGYVPVYFSENDAEQLRAMFDDCRRVASKDDAVLSIILEEASAYFSGVRNIDDTLKFITDRVNTRIHE